MSEAIRRMLAEREQLAASPRQKGCRLLDAIDRAAPFVDAGWVARPGRRLKPSAMMGLRVCVLMTSSEADAPSEARRLVDHWLSTARARWKAGYRANPFDEPVMRNAPVRGEGNVSPEKDTSR